MTQVATHRDILLLPVDIPGRDSGVKIACQIATDNLGGGRDAGKAMIEALGEAGGKVAILHFKQAESCRLRVQGFKEVVNAHNAKEKGKIDIVAELDGGGLKNEGYKAAEDAVQAHPGLRGIL